MRLLIVILMTLLIAGCTRKVDERIYHSPYGDQTILLGHESCGAGCNAKDTLKLKFTALDGTKGEANLATIHGAAKIELDWPNPQHLVIGACNASSASISSDIIRLDNSKTSVRTEVILTTVALPLQGKTYCAGF